MLIPAGAIVMLAGDSITAAPIACLTAIQVASDARYAVSKPTYPNEAVSGYDTSNVDTDMTPDLIAATPTHVIVRVGINDLIHARTAAQTAASVASYSAKIIAGGINPANVLYVDALVWGERPIDGANTAAGGNDEGIKTVNRIIQYYAALNGFKFAETRDRYWRPWELAANATNPPAGHGVFTTTDDGFAGQLGVHPTTPIGRDMVGSWVLNYVAFS